MEEILKQLLKGQKQIHSELKTLNNRVNNLEQVQNELKKGQDELRNGQNDLKKGQDRTEARLDLLEKGQDELRNGQNDLKKGQDRTEARLDLLEKGLVKLETRMESEVIEKVRSLYDAHSLQMDYFESLKNGQARIESAVETISRRMTHQDLKIETYERELRLIRSEKQKKQ